LDLELSTLTKKKLPAVLHFKIADFDPEDHSCQGKKRYTDLQIFYAKSSDYL
jgi:hypothetical protein